MLILSLDTSGKQASCALLRDGTVLAFERRDALLDHSRTMLPLCQELLDAQGLTLGDVDLFSAVVGPGSFTGVRIGTAAVKGFSWALGKPCVGVSSLLAIASADGLPDGVVCAAVFARPGEHYFALFRREQGMVTRLTDDRPAPDDEMAAECARYGCTLTLSDTQDAASAARAALAMAQRGEVSDCHGLTPVYLKIPQAERLRKEGKL